LIFENIHIYCEKEYSLIEMTPLSVGLYFVKDNPSGRLPPYRKQDRALSCQQSSKAYGVSKFPCPHLWGKGKRD
jgi:hypothetical protein